MAGTAEGNYIADVNQASSITIFQTQHKKYSDGYNYYQKEIKVTIYIKEVYKY